MAWRLARSLETLRNEVNAAWPSRSKVSDGTVGDQAHSSRASDHNPNAAGVVRAMDITAAGIDANGYAERLRQLGATGHPPLRNGGMVIWNRRIANATAGWTWRPYTGTNPHDKHVHVSVGRNLTDYDSTARWGIGTTTQPKDDFMAALTEAEQRELLNRVRTSDINSKAANERCERLERSIHGTSEEERNDSMWWRVHYLSGELLAGENLERLRQLMRKYGGPEI